MTFIYSRFLGSGTFRSILAWSRRLHRRISVSSHLVSRTFRCFLVWSRRLPRRTSAWCLPPMAHLQPLQALNKSSAQVASFGVRLSGGNVTEYTFISKRDQTEVTAYKFEVYLVGNKPHEYCVGFIKGSRDVCRRAATRFTDESVWALSKVSLDTFTPAQYISTPILFRVDLTKSIMSIRYADTEANTGCLRDRWQT